MMEFCPNI